MNWIEKYQLGYKIKGYDNTNFEQPATDWLDNWLSSRIPILDANMGGKGKDFTKASLEYAKQMENIANTKSKYGTAYEVNYELPQGKDYAGKYDPDRRMVIYRKESWLPEVSIHERTHAARGTEEDIPQYKAIEKILKLNKGEKKDPYLDKPTEIYSRMMELRYNKKLNPSDKVNDLKGIDLKWYGLDRYEPESIMKLLNEVADINQESGDNLTT